MFAVFLTIFFDGGDGGGGEHFWHVKSACSDRKVLYLPVSQVVCGVLGKLFFLKLPVSLKFMTQTGDVCFYLYKYAWLYIYDTSDSLGPNFALIFLTFAQPVANT